MAQHTCPNCGHTFASTTKARKPATVAAVDPSTLNDAEYFAYCKRTAPIEDARFMLRVSTSLTPALRSRLETLIATNPPRTEFYRQLTAIQADWRRLPRQEKDVEFAKMRAQIAWIDRCQRFRRRRSDLLERIERTFAGRASTSYGNNESRIAETAAETTRTLVQVAREAFPNASCFRAVA